MKFRLWWLCLLTFCGSGFRAETISDHRPSRVPTQEGNADAKSPEIQPPPPVTSDQIQLPETPVTSTPSPTDRTPASEAPDPVPESEDGFPQFVLEGSARVPSADGKSSQCPSEKKRFPFVSALNAWLVAKNPKLTWKEKRTPYANFVFYVDRTNGKYFAEAKSLEAFRQKVLEEIGIVGDKDNAAWIYYEGKTPNFEEQTKLKHQLQAIKDPLKFFDVIHTHTLGGTKFRIETISTSGLWFVNNVRAEDFERLEKVFEPSGEETLESKSELTRPIIAQSLFDSFLLPTLKASKGSAKLTKKQEETLALFAKCSSASKTASEKAPEAKPPASSPTSAENTSEDPEIAPDGRPVRKAPASEAAPGAPVSEVPVTPPPLLENPEDSKKENSSISPPLSPTAQPM
jgi:hypothetical protein